MQIGELNRSMAEFLGSVDGGGEEEEEEEATTSRSS